jgi:hypothetical protein
MQKIHLLLLTQESIASYSVADKDAIYETRYSLNDAINKLGALNDRRRGEQKSKGKSR